MDNEGLREMVNDRLLSLEDGSWKLMMLSLPLQSLPYILLPIITAFPLSSLQANIFHRPNLPPDTPRPSLGSSPQRLHPFLETFSKSIDHTARGRIRIRHHPSHTRFVTTMAIHSYSPTRRLSTNRLCAAVQTACHVIFQPNSAPNARTNTTNQKSQA